MAAARIIMGIDPGLAHTGWGVVQQKGASLSCVAYGCVATQPTMSLHQRLAKSIHRYPLWFCAISQNALLLKRCGSARMPKALLPRDRLAALL